MDSYSPSINHSHDLLEWGITERAAIKQEMDKLNLRLKNVNSAVLSTMERLKMKSFKHGLGTMTWKAASESHGIDKDKLIVAMLSAGIDAAVVDGILKAADKVIQRPASVAFTPDRSGPDGDVS